MANSYFETENLLDDHESLIQTCTDVFKIYYVFLLFLALSFILCNSAIVRCLPCWWKFKNIIIENSQGFNIKHTAVFDFFFFFFTRFYFVYQDYNCFLIVSIFLWCFCTSLYFNLFHYFRCVFLLTCEFKPTYVTDITGIAKIFFYNHPFLLFLLFLQLMILLFKKVFLWYLGIFAFFGFSGDFYIHVCIYVF